jgi:uncharacterized protein
MAIPCTTTTATTTPPSSPPPSRPDPSTLSPEALDLAARLFNLARTGNTTALQSYLSAGIPPNLTDSQGNTLLMLAAYHGHANTVSMLLARGADANALNERGQTPLAGAVFKGYADVVGVLVREGGADADGGVPSAREAAVMFRRGEMFGVLGIQGEGNEEEDGREDA